MVAKKVFVSLALPLALGLLVGLVFRLVLQQVQVLLLGSQEVQ